MPKIVFFDIDGTLVTPQNRLPDSTRQAIQQLKRNGHVPVLSTGRPPKMLATVADELVIDNYISLNGQYIVINGKPFFSNVLPTDKIEQLIEASYEVGDRAFLLTKDGVIGNTFMNEMIQDAEFLTFVYTHLQELPLEVTAELFRRMSEKPLKREKYEDAEILSAFIHTNEQKDAFYQDQFPDMHFTRATPFLGEATMKGSHKAAAMEKVVRHFQKTMEDAIAFGDSLNDLEMIDAAGCGVAMENGRQEIKVIADYVTSHVEEDGIYHGLKHLKLI